MPDNEYFLNLSEVSGTKDLRWGPSTYGRGWKLVHLELPGGISFLERQNVQQNMTNSCELVNSRGAPDTDVPPGDSCERPEIVCFFPEKCLMTEGALLVPRVFSMGVDVKESSFSKDKCF